MTYQSKPNIYKHVNINTLIFMLYISNPGIGALLNTLTQDTNQYGIITTIINLIVICYIIHLIILDRVPIDTILIAFLLMLLCLVSIAFNPLLGPIIAEEIPSMVKCFCGYYIFSRVIDFEIIERSLKYISASIIIYSTIILFGSGSLNQDNSVYFPASYSIVIQVGMLFASSRGNPIYLLSGVLGTVAILFAGARGALFCVVIAVVLLKLNQLKQATLYKRVLIFTLIILIIGIIMSNYISILSFLHHIFPSSRTILKLLNNEVQLDINRETIYRNILYDILSKPLLGHGIFADRIVGGEVFHTGAVAGSYAHNFILEIVYQFGIIVGIPIIIFIIRSITCAYLKLKVQNENQQLVSLFIVLFSSSVVQLLFSSSYLICYQFWCFLGFITLILRKEFHDEARF